MVGVLVFLLFIDSWKRAQVLVGSGQLGENGHPSLQALASKAYNQRNVYISGFILFFTLLIPMLHRLNVNLVKYKTEIREMENDDNWKKLEKELSAKEKSLKGLQIQVRNLNSQFDAKVGEKNDEPELDKKNN